MLGNGQKNKKRTIKRRSIRKGGGERERERGFEHTRHRKKKEIIPKQYTEDEGLAWREDLIVSGTGKKRLIKEQSMKRVELKRRERITRYQALGKKKRNKQ